MAGIQTFRERYPQYGHISDTDIAEAVLKKDYADADRDQFMSAFLGAPDVSRETLVEPAPEPVPEPEPFQEPEQTPIESMPDAPAMEDTPTDLSDFGVTAEMQQAAPKEAEPFAEVEEPQESLSITHEGTKYEINREGYDSDEAATDAFLSGDNPPISVVETDKWNEDLLLKPERIQEVDRSFEDDMFRPEGATRGKDLLARVAKGVVEGGGGMLKGLATIDQIQKDQDEVTKWLREEFKDKKGKQYEWLKEYASDDRPTLEKIKGDSWYKAGQKLVDFSNKTFDTNPEYDELFISKAAQGLGSMAVFMATTLVHPIAGAFAGAGMNADAQFEDAIRSGASFEDAMKAAKVGAVWGLTEVAPIEYAFSRINRATGGWFSKTVTDKIKSKIGQVGVEGLVGGLGEYIQEAFMEFANNFSAKTLIGYDKERDLWQGVEESGEVGGVLGFLLTTITSAFGVRKRGRALKDDLPSPPDDSLDLRQDIPIDELPTLEDADPREVIRRKSHRELMENPVYRRFYDASDLGELSGSHEERAAEAKAAYIRKAEQIKKWKPIVEEAVEKQEEAAEEVEPVGEEAAVEEREVFEEEKAVEPELPDGYDPSETVVTNIDGKETSYDLATAAGIVERFDKNEETSPVSREERDQIEVQLDEYRQRYDEQESIDSPRSEAREERPIKMPPGVEDVDVATLGLNPKLMQYKSGTDLETGRSEALKGVQKYDEAKAGIIVAWEDVTGKRVVADGHQRVNLLKDLQAQGKEKDTKMLTRVYREEDGYTAKDVRTIAAEINIAQGTGTAMDAAKVIKELTGKEYADFIEKMPVNSAIVRDAVGLAKLSEEAFEVVVNELIEPRYGSMVGNAFEEAEQTAAMQILIRSKPSTFNEAYAMIADIKAGGFVKSEQGGLFGEVEMESLIKQRAEILSTAEKKLRKNISVFNALIGEEKRITEAGENVLDTEANIQIVKESQGVMDRALRTINTNPELNEALNEIAKRYKAGDISRIKAANEFVEAAKSYTDSRGGKPDARPGVEGTGKDAEAKEVKGQVAEEEGIVADVTEEAGAPTKKKPSQITLVEKMEIEETGEMVTVSENAAQALLRINKRISVTEKIRDCMLS